MSVKNHNKVKFTEIRYIKLPYIREFFRIAKRKVMKLFKLARMKAKVFSVSKFHDYFFTKDPLLGSLNSFLVYQFTCASCGTRYMGCSKTF